MSASSDVLPPDRIGSPSSLIVTFTGCYLRQIGGWIAVADLIRMLEFGGVSDASVRQAVRRLTSRGFLCGRRQSGAAGYALTDDGRADLVPGDSRIFRYGQADLSAGWILAVFAVPETEGHHRHQLRSQLTWLGFGTIGPGTWVAPAALTDVARELLASSGLEKYVTWFRAQALDAVDVSAWWDLAALAAQYQVFLDRWEQRLSAPDESTDRAAFEAYIRLVDSWRLLPRVDPGLPAELLPADWPGSSAWRVFSALRKRWADAGLRHVSETTGLPAASDRV